MQDLEERNKLIELYDKYSALLTQSQKQAIYLHLFEDLSFSEIANELAMTRAGAYDAVNKAKKKLLLLDEKINEK
ncbi:sigma factor-like helix-turn-helix DNA-binding protein [Metamycoplasma alkalescens]|uniref:Uncharacterized protein n=2 Tax=Metamycoplasma alkalescens TaxID=45363 RepID=N9UAX4_9BACT|nr:sigma factor-like helix-turn-helix DNA-binding protein [Metamycoplasma alkalescens]ENY53816.1 Hypothetical protein MALK_4180 [Metamycoplasma alkalescens 14918]PYF43769.1 hypothetical protein BCF88_10187 [Metamycoplasma alkalescens]SYV90517.1 sigma-70 factor-like HTH protein [Metamycoplasma alkalescens]